MRPVVRNLTFPRWLITTLLTSSLLAVLGYGAWWWVTWPERTAREFVRSTIEDPDEAAKSFLSSELRHVFELEPPAISAEEAAEQSDMPIEEVRKIISEREEYEREAAAKYPRENIQSRPRSLLDLVKGRQVFEQQMDDWMTSYFAVERGTIIDIGFVFGSEDKSYTRDWREFR